MNKNERKILLTWKKLLSEMIGVRFSLRFVSSDDNAIGFVNWHKKLVVLDKNACFEFQMRALFHESIHLYAYQYEIYKTFHTKDPKFDRSRYITRKLYNSWVRTGYNAEVWVEDKAIELLTGFFPDLKIHNGYKSKEGYEFFNSYFKNYNRWKIIID